jgi:hypothetical protein
MFEITISVRVAFFEYYQHDKKENVSVLFKNYLYPTIYLHFFFMIGPPYVDNVISMLIMSSSLTLVNVALGRGTEDRLILTP